MNAAPAGCFVMISITGGRVHGVVPRIKDLEAVIGAFAGRRVVDETGLVGRFELSFAFNLETAAGPLASIQSHLAEDLPSFADALRDDLGFTLESSRHHFPVLIVEHLEQPTEN